MWKLLFIRLRYVYLYIYIIYIYMYICMHMPRGMYTIQVIRTPNAGTRLLGNLHPWSCMGFPWCLLEGWTRDFPTYLPVTTGANTAPQLFSSDIARLRRTEHVGTGSSRHACAAATRLEERSLRAPNWVAHPQRASSASSLSVQETPW